MDQFNSTLIGLACALFSGVFFGSMFTPIRKYDIRDGFFVQWIQSATIFVFGMIVSVVQDHPKFEQLAALGGLIFATSNIAAIPLVNKFGAGPAMLFCGSIQITVGWATARFGLLGLKEQIPAFTYMNYAGIILTLGSGILFSLVTNKPASEWEHVATADEYSESLEVMETKADVDESEPRESCFFKSQHFYLIIAILSGSLSGLIHAPVGYLQDNVKDASQRDLDYVFSYFCGIFSGATIYFIIYCVVKKNRPYVSPETILPSVLYGLMWSFAMTSWFFANRLLSQAISFPIVTRGTKNLLLLAVAISIALAGVILVGLSK